MDNNRGYYGTNYPTQIANNNGYGIVGYVLIAAPTQGLYLGTHDTTGRELVSYMTVLKPGHEDSYQGRLPQEPTIGGHPARRARSGAFPFSECGGEWIPRKCCPKSLQRRLARWGGYLQKVEGHLVQTAADAGVGEGASIAWQQMQIFNSSEDDLRTPYRDLPRRAGTGSEEWRCCYPTGSME